MVKALFIWGIIQSLLVSILIPLINNVRRNYLLSLILLTTSLNILFQYVLRFTDLKFTLPQLLVTPDFLDLLLPTLIYTYLIKIFRDFTSNKFYLFFILPVCWGIVLAIFVIFKKDFHFNSYINTNLHLLSQTLVFLWKLFLLIKISKYFHWSRKPLKNKHKALLRWPRTLIIFMGLITLVGFFNLAFFIFRKITDNMNTTLITVLRDISDFNYIIFTCCIIFISIYFFTKQPQVLAGSSLFRLNKPKGDSDKYDDLFRKLRKMEKKGIVLNTELNESGLAEKLGVKSYLLSKFLNERLGKSFNEYINEKRIEEAKRLLEKKEYKDLTIFAIAVDSGFNSESSFYSNFKKYTGMTPKQYRTKMLNT